MALRDRDLNKFSPKSVEDRIHRARRSGTGEGDEEAAIERDPGDTMIFTLLTTPGDTHLIYTASTWVRVRLTLTTAGPVVVGNAQSLDPVTSGKGFFLTPDVPTEFTLGRGSRLYYAATSTNRVSVSLEPIPWLREIADTLTGIPKALAKAIRG